jgi:putative spermidine/putrescine transport system permease protein
VPFLLYVAVFLLLPVGVLAVEAFRATDPVTFEDTWSTANIGTVTGGAYARAYLGSLQLSAVTAVLGAVLGLALAFAVVTTRRGRLLRRLVLTASDVLGASGWQYWRYVGGPVLAPPVLGATMLLFASAFAAYATAKALVGSSVPLVTLQIADSLSSNVVVGAENLGKALALGMVVLVGLVMAFYTWVQRRTSRWLA